MNNRKAVIVGCVKNAAEFLPDVFLNLDKFSDLFAETAFIFIENDSNDGTKNLLHTWGLGKKNFFIHNLDGLDRYEPSRTVRLEIARNAYIKSLLNNKKFLDFDFLIIMDMDDRGAYPLSIDALNSALNFLTEKEDRAAVFANQPQKYYDLWALRHPQLCPFDFWHEVLARSLVSSTDQEAFESINNKVLKSIPNDNPPIQVESAFGGLGIYKMNYILNNNSRYIGHEYKYFFDKEMIFTKLQTCEHVSFHKGISAQGGTMYILPFLINSDSDTTFNPSAFRTIIIK